MRLIALALIYCGLLSAQVAHPRIWLDAPTKTRLLAMVAANDPTWVALKARADVLVAAPVSPFVYPYSIGTDPICYGCGAQYRGSGWYEAMTVLSMAYQMTGDVAYANQVKAVMKVMVGAGATETAHDDGYDVRNYGPALAIAYDWIYDQLSPTSDTIGVGSGNDISNLTGLMYLWWTTVTGTFEYNFEWRNNTCSPQGNYYWGYMLGFGLGVIAMEGDDPNMLAIKSNLVSRMQTCVIPATGAGTVYSGAYNPQGSVYAPQYHTFDYIRALQTSGQVSAVLGSWDYTAWLKQAVKQTIHFLTPMPGYTQYISEGSVSANGAYTFNMNKNMLNRLPLMLSGTTEAGHAQYMLNRRTGPKDSLVNEFLYKSDEPEVDFTTTEPPYYLSPGDYHQIARSDWTSTATQAVIMAGQTAGLIEHTDVNWGSVVIRRGSDYLLANPSSCTTPNCYGPGDGSAYDQQGGWMANSLFVDDSTQYLANRNRYCSGYESWDSMYKFAGCMRRGNMVVIPPMAHLESALYTYAKLDLTNSYGNAAYITTSPLTNYKRSWATFGGGAVSFVYDYVVARTPGGGHRSLFWHLPTMGTISSPGSLVSNTVGGSKLWIATLLPSANLKTHFEKDFEEYTGFSLPTTAVTTAGSTVLNISNPNWTAIASAATPTSSTMLHTGTNPVGVNAGMLVTDLTNPGALPAGEIITAIQPYAPWGSLSLNLNPIGGGVLAGDTLQFSLNLVGMAVNGAGIPDGTTIIAATPTTATMSAAATADIATADDLSFTIVHPIIGPPNRTNRGNTRNVLASKRLVVDDATYLTNSTTPFFTILAATSSTATQPVTANIAGSGFVGGTYTNEGATKGAAFSSDGTTRSGFSLSAAYSGPGTIVIADLAPGTYSVTQNGAALTTQSVGSDGTLSFTASDGGVFAAGAPAGTAPTITTATLPPGTLGTTYTATLTATGDAPINWSLDSGSLPSGVTLSASTGVISGTPTTSGTATFTLRATNAVGASTRTFSIVVSTAPLPVVTPPVLISGKTSITGLVTIGIVASPPTFNWSVLTDTLWQNLTSAQWSILQ